MLKNESLGKQVSLSFIIVWGHVGYTTTKPLWIVIIDQMTEVYNGSFQHDANNPIKGTNISVMEIQPFCMKGMYCLLVALYF